MLQFEGIDHLVIRVKNLAPMLHFYQAVLGCALERVREDLGLYQLRAGASLIDLITHNGPLGQMRGGSPDPASANLDHFCLTVSHFDEQAIRQHLKLNGYEASESATRYGARGYGPSVYVTDPEGNVVELKGPLGAPNP